MCLVCMFTPECNLLPLFCNCVRKKMFYFLLCTACFLFFLLYVTFLYSKQNICDTS
ncbi:hypothetical protein HanPI659440_Chr11g0417201 [Helianthus annuus]|nr:hypothetical protein HanPI659440_Chr11g0417201 [Helianthus annuus]